MSAEIALILAEALKTIGVVIADVKDKRQTGLIESAGDALTVIGAIVESVGGGDLKKIDPVNARTELDRLRDALSKNDAEADRLLKKKFMED
jgi:hypothetical protein